MTYVISDLHGCYEKYLEMLDKIAFCENDVLYVLGDVIDRGEGGVAILFDMMKRKNVKAIIGNHESLALNSLKAIRDDEPFCETSYFLWMASEGEATRKVFETLSKKDQASIIDYIESFSIYDEIEIGNQKFHLSHTLPDYKEGIKIHDVSFLEFLYGEVDYDKVYCDDTLFVTGHTPTALIDPSFAGKIYKANNHIAIDCGAVFEKGRLGAICLETMQEFYV